MKKPNEYLYQYPNWRVSLARKNCWCCFWRKLREVWIILITKRKCLKRPSNWGKMIPINNASKYHRTVDVYTVYALNGWDYYHSCNLSTPKLLTFLVLIQAFRPAAFFSRTQAVPTLVTERVGNKSRAENIFAALRKNGQKKALLDKNKNAPHWIIQSGY